jgi:hypothetical protein
MSSHVNVVARLSVLIPVAAALTCLAACLLALPDLTLAVSSSDSGTDAGTDGSGPPTVDASPDSGPSGLAFCSDQADAAFCEDFESTRVAWTKINDLGLIQIVDGGGFASSTGLRLTPEPVLDTVDGGRQWRQGGVKFASGWKKLFVEFKVRVQRPASAAPYDYRILELYFSDPNQYQLIAYVTGGASTNRAKVTGQYNKLTIGGKGPLIELLAPTAPFGTWAVVRIIVTPEVAFRLQLDPGEGDASTISYGRSVLDAGDVDILINPRWNNTGDAALNATVDDIRVWTE